MVVDGAGLVWVVFVVMSVYGIVYALIGWVAFKAASASGQPEGASGALATLADEPYPHAAAVWPFGESVHYTDGRPDAPQTVAPGQLDGELCV